MNRAALMQRIEQHFGAKAMTRGSDLAVLLEDICCQVHQWARADALAELHPLWLAEKERADRASAPAAPVDEPQDTTVEQDVIDALRGSGFDVRGETADAIVYGTVHHGALLIDAAIQAFYGRSDVPTGETPEAGEPDKRPLFDRKLTDLQQRGYEVIGRILHKGGEYALFDSSCRWLTKAQYQRLMHEQDGSLFAAQQQVERAALLVEGVAVQVLPRLDNLITEIERGEYASNLLPYLREWREKTRATFNACKPADRITFERFCEKMDALDAANPGPLQRLLTAQCEVCAGTGTAFGKTCNCTKGASHG